MLRDALVATILRSNGGKIEVRFGILSFLVAKRNAHAIVTGEIDDSQIVCF
jgi:hypothetical protein